MALLVAHQNIHIGDHGRRGGKLLENLILPQLLHGEVAAAFQISHGQAAHHLRPLQQLIGLLPPGIVIA